MLKKLYLFGRYHFNHKSADHECITVMNKWESACSSTRLLFYQATIFTVIFGIFSIFIFVQNNSARQITLPIIGFVLTLSLSLLSWKKCRETKNFEYKNTNLPINVVHEAIVDTLSNLGLDYSCLESGDHHKRYRYSSQRTYALRDPAFCIRVEHAMLFSSDNLIINIGPLSNKSQPYIRKIQTDLNDALRSPIYRNTSQDGQK